MANPRLFGSALQLNSSLFVKKKDISLWILLVGLGLPFGTWRRLLLVPVARVLNATDARPPSVWFGHSGASL
jgi:hypothetical protein